MRPQSAKAKGRKLQQWARDKLIEYFGLSAQDVRSTSMGSAGEDLLFSPAAQKMIPFSIECKNRGAIAVYGWWEQACSQEKVSSDIQPLVILKQDRSQPLALCDADWLFKTMKELHDHRQRQQT